MPDDLVPEVPAENTQAIRQPESDASKHRGGRRSTSWPRGVSGNPRGRPRKGQTFRDLIEKIGSEKIEAAPDKDGKKHHRISQKEQVVRALFREAVAGNIPAIRELITRLDGLPKSEIDLNLEGSKASQNKPKPVSMFAEMLRLASDDPEMRTRVIKLEGDRLDIQDELETLAEKLGATGHAGDSNGRE